MFKKACITIVTAVMITAFASSVFALEAEPRFQIFYSIGGKSSVEGPTNYQTIWGYTSPFTSDVTTPDGSHWLTSNELLSESYGMGRAGIRFGVDFTLLQTKDKSVKLKLGPEFTYYFSNSAGGTYTQFQESMLKVNGDYATWKDNVDVKISSNVYGIGLMVSPRIRLGKNLNLALFVGPTINSISGDANIKEEHTVESNFLTSGVLQSWDQSESFNEWAFGVSVGGGLQGNLKPFFEWVFRVEKAIDLFFNVGVRYNYIGSVEKEVGGMVFKQNPSNVDFNFGLSYPFDL